MSTNLGTATTSTSIDGSLSSIHLPTLNADVDMRCMPVAFTFAQTLPMDGVACDYFLCYDATDWQNVVRMSCSHTYHRQCLSQMPHKCCDLCLPNIRQRVKELAASFNSNLLIHSSKYNQEDIQDINIQPEEGATDLSLTEEDVYLSPDFLSSLEKRLQDITIPANLVDS